MMGPGLLLRSEKAQGRQAPEAACCSCTNMPGHWNVCKVFELVTTPTSQTSVSFRFCCSACVSAAGFHVFAWLHLELQYVLYLF